MTEAELMRRIRLGEDSALEFQSVAVDRGRVIRFDESPVPNTGRGDLDYALTQRFLRGDAAEPGGDGETLDAAAEDDLLHKLRILTRNDDGAVDPRQPPPPASQPQRTDRLAAGALRGAIRFGAHALDGPARRRRADHSQGVRGAVRQSS